MQTLSPFSSVSKKNNNVCYSPNALWCPLNFGPIFFQLFIYSNIVFFRKKKTFAKHPPLQFPMTHKCLKPSSYCIMTPRTSFFICFACQKTVDNSVDISIECGKLTVCILGSLSLTDSLWLTHTAVIVKQYLQQHLHL